jgi:hypothetical protein
MTSTSESPKPKKHEFPCQACGAKLVFDPNQDDLACTHCGQVQEIEKNDGQAIIEYSLAEARARKLHIPIEALSGHGSEVHCTSCGAVYLVDGHAGACPFCDSPVVLEDTDSEVIAPESVLSFRVDRREANRMFEHWVRRLWFAPNDLRARARAHGLDGVYLPHWAFSSSTKTAYTGLRGRYYWVERDYTDKEGKRRTKKVRRTKWRPAFGTIYADFDDVLVCGSRSLPMKLVRRLEPWDLDALRPYKPDYLSGYVAERYGVDLEQSFSLAQDRMEADIRRAIRRDIGGDTQVISSLRVKHRKVGFKHMLFPLWISSFRYKEKVYRFAVNARTGKVSGERPWSTAKIALAVGLALAVAGLVWWLKNRPELIG